MRAIAMELPTDKFRKELEKLNKILVCQRASRKLETDPVFQLTQHGHAENCTQLVFSQKES